MAMTLHDYFRTRCTNTLHAERNIEALFKNMTKVVEDTTLKDFLHRYHDAIECEVGGLEQITARLSGGGEKKTRKRNTGTENEQEMVIVGRGWIGTVGAEVVETHRTFVTIVPQYLVDINAAMVAEEITHFNIGDYTGLIVLAKQLGEHEIADMLQQNIDIETNMRAELESGGLTRIVAEQAGQERKAA